jgi:hypothetical protein
MLPRAVQSTPALQGGPLPLSPVNAACVLLLCRGLFDAHLIALLAIRSNQNMIPVNLEVAEARQARTAHSHC